MNFPVFPGLFLPRMNQCSQVQTIANSWPSLNHSVQMKLNAQRRTWSKTYPQVIYRSTETTQIRWHCTQRAQNDPPPTTVETNDKAIILDGMAVVHELSGQQIKTCLEIAYNTGFHQSNWYLHTSAYCFWSLWHWKFTDDKNKNRRQGKQGACCKYDVTDRTQLNMPLNRFLSNSENKDKLSKYLAKKVIHVYMNSTKSVIVDTKDGAMIYS